MARLINLSAITIFIALVGFVTITEAADCEQNCTPTEGFQSYDIEDAKKFIKDAWNSSCAKSFCVADINEAYRNNEIADNTRFIIKTTTLKDCNVCYNVECIKGFIGFPGIPTITQKTGLVETDIGQCNICT